MRAMALLVLLLLRDRREDMVLYLLALSKEYRLDFEIFELESES